MSLKKQLTELETTLEQLESEDIELDQAFKLYESAIKTASKTVKKINTLNNSFKILTKEHNSIIETIEKGDQS